jgi:hypothetical protein
MEYGVFVYIIPSRFMRAFQSFEGLKEVLILHPEVETEDTSFGLVECLGRQVKEGFVERARRVIGRKRFMLRGGDEKISIGKYTFPVRATIVSKHGKVLFSVPQVSTLAYSTPGGVTEEEGMRGALTKWSKDGEGSVQLKLT